MTVSLFLIILTFFVLLNSIAKLDKRKTLLALGSLVGSFGSFKGGLSPMKSVGGMSVPPSPPLVKKTLDYQELLAMMEGEILGDVKVESKKQRDILTISEEALFEEKSPVLRASAYPLLMTLSTYINKGDYPVEIVGHTDDRPAEEKGFRSNWELSALMAVRVVKYLVMEGRVAPERLSAMGAGSYRPVASNDTRRSRAQNRRVELIFRHGAPAHIKRILHKRPKGIFTYKMFDFKVFGE